LVEIQIFKRINNFWQKNKQLKSKNMSYPQIIQYNQLRFDLTSIKISIKPNKMIIKYP